MKRAAALGTLWLAVALAACAASRLVLNVDVLSFLRPDSLDAFSFSIPGGVGQTDLTVSRPFTLPDRKSTRLNSSHVEISYAVFCLKKKKYSRHSSSSNTKARQHIVRV